MGVFDNNIKSNLQPTEDVLRKVVVMIVTDCADQFMGPVRDVEEFAKVFGTHLIQMFKLHTCEGGMLDILHPGIEAYVFEPSLYRIYVSDEHILNMDITVVLYVPTGIIDPAYKIEKQTRYQFDIPVQIPA